MAVGAGFENGLVFAENADFSGNSNPNLTNGLQTNGQIWIGTTTPNSGGTHVNVNTLTAGPGVSITNGSGSITIGLSGGGTGVDSFAMQSGTSPVIPDSNGLVTFNGGVGAQGTNPVITVGGTNTMTLTVQKAQAIAATDATKIGLAAFDSAKFSVDANGFVTTSAVLTDYHVSRFIVSAGGSADGANYTTIASAVAAAVTAGGSQTIVIQPGTYTENFSVTTNLTFEAFSGVLRTNSPNVIIQGKCTVSTSSLKVSFNGISFLTNSDVNISLTGNASELTVQNCYFNGTNANSISCTGNGSTNIYLENCSGSFANTFTLLTTTNAVCWVKDSIFIDVTGTPGASTTSSGTLHLINSRFVFPFTTSSVGVIDAYKCQFGFVQTPYTNTTWITTAGTGASFIQDCIVYSGTATAILAGAGTTIDCTGTTVSSSNTNAISGAGIVNFGGVIFSGSSSTINTTTQVPYIQSNDAIKVVTPGAYPYTTTSQDGLILVDTSSARTITPLASPTTGQRHIIKDSVGSAAANNITVTPSGKNIDGSASYTINVNYGSITIIYSGSQWLIV